MKFTKMEYQARQIVLSAGSEISVDEIWTRLGKSQFQPEHWRNQANELMRNVCIKSEIISPKIERKTRLGHGAKAVYGTAQ